MLVSAASSSSSSVPLAEGAMPPSCSRESGDVRPSAAPPKEGVAVKLVSFSSWTPARRGFGPLPMKRGDCREFDRPAVASGVVQLHVLSAGGPRIYCMCGRTFSCSIAGAARRCRAAVDLVCGLGISGKAAEQAANHSAGGGAASAQLAVEDEGVGGRGRPDVARKLVKVTLLHKLCSQISHMTRLHDWYIVRRRPDWLIMPYEPLRAVNVSSSVGPADLGGGPIGEGHPVVLDAVTLRRKLRIHLLRRLDCIRPCDHDKRRVKVV